MTEIGNKPILGSSEWLEWTKKQEEELKRARENRPPRIDEHLDLDATARLDMARKGRHPAGHIRTGLPVGTSTVGVSSRGEDPGR